MQVTTLLTREEHDHHDHAHADADHEHIPVRLWQMVAGVIFIAHGYQKFFVMGIEGTTGFFTQVGAPLPGISAIVVATVELVGGALLLLGIFTRFIAIPLAIDIATAIVLFHSKHGFFVPMGVEFVTLLLASAIAIAIAGPGAFSVDEMTRRKRE